MFGRPQGFDNFLAQLEELSRTFPARAQAFHARLGSLAARAREAQKTTFRPARVQEEAKVLRIGEGISELAGRIQTVLTSGEALAAQAEAVIAQAEASNDPLLKNSVLMHLGECRRKLAVMGMDIDSEAGLAAAQEQLADLRLTVEREKRALQLFGEASTLEPLLAERNSLAAAALSVDLETWRKEFATSPDPGWLARIDKALDDHRRKAQKARTNPPIPSPPSVSAPPPAPVTEQAAFSGVTINLILSECREWSQLLTGEIEAVSPLMERRRHLDDEHARPEQFNALGIDAQTLRDSLRTRVLQKYEARGRELASRLELFYSVCKQAAPLSTSLPPAIGTTPASLAEFQEALETLYREFTSLAQLHRGVLNQERTARLYEVEQDILKVQEKRRSQYVQDSLSRMLTTLPKVTDLPTDGVSLLDDLDRLGAQRAQIHQWAKESAAMVAQYLAKREEMGRKLEAWRPALSRLAGHQHSWTSGYQEWLASTESWPENAILDTYTKQLHEIEAAFQRDEVSWRRVGQEQVKRVQQKLSFEFGQIHDLPGMEGATIPPVSASSEPGELADALDVLELHTTRLRIAVGQAAHQLRTEIPALRQRLTGFTDDPERIHHPSRSLALEILSVCPSVAEPAAPDTIESLTPLREWWRQCDSFFFALDHEHSSLLEDIQAARRKAEDLHRENFNRFRPTMFSRAWRLISGSEMGANDPETSRKLLQEGNGLLNAIARDAERRAVGELTAAFATLTANARSSKNVQVVSRANRLIAELTQMGPGQLPSAAVRREAVLLASRLEKS